MKNTSKAIIAITAVCGGVLLAGCAKPQETIVVQPQEKVIEKTTIKAAPPKTIIVKPAPQTAPKTTVKTEVEVKVAATPTAVPSTLPTPLPTAKPTSTPRAKPTVKPTARPTAKPIVAPQPTAQPVVKTTVKPKATATPRVVVKTDSKNLVVRAEVVATSKVPDPKTVPYKESLVFTKYKILSVQSGQYKEKEILVAQWGMKDKKLLAPSRNRIGQVQTLTLEPLSGDLDSVMRNDDTSEFELEPYFAK